MSIYDLIYADPAWTWSARSPKGEGRSARNHYNVMSLQEIKDLPVPLIAADRSVLLIWAIDSMIPQALEVIEAWGFEYKTVGFYWVKTNKRAPSLFDGNKLRFETVDLLKCGGKSVFFMGLGYYTRANPEICLLATRKNGIEPGGLKVKDKGVPRLIVSPVGKHSQKPEEARIRIERLFGDVRRVELFARSRRPGWDAWGNQVEDSISLGGL